MSIIFNGGNHIDLMILFLASHRFNIGQKEPYLIGIKVYGAAGT